MPVDMSNIYRVAIAFALSAVFATPAFAQCIGGSSTCSLMETAPVIFAGTLASEHDGYFHFVIQERFKGISRDEIDILDLPPVEGSTGFNGAGKKYLVFASTTRLDDGKVETWVGGCGHQMVEATYAPALLEQLRREKRRQARSAVYGMVVRSQYNSAGSWDDAYYGPMPSIAVHLQSPDGTFTAKTDAAGAFAFDRLPKGTYTVSADLPKGLRLGQEILDDSLPPIEVESGTCNEYRLTAVPATRISGRVIGPDGVPRASTSVFLFRADEYKDGASGAYAYQGDGKPFDYTRLAPGDYILKFGSTRDRIAPDNPFPPTFYPSALDVRRATVIHLAEGQQILDADIHLPAPIPTRTIEVVLDWNGRRRGDYMPPSITAEPDEAQSPYWKGIAADRYEVTLRRDSIYRLHVRTPCWQPSTGTATSDTVTVSGGDEAVSRVTLTFPPGGCGPR
jgi:hypothetical protein